jgi:hypothetical protein
MTYGREARRQTEKTKKTETEQARQKNQRQAPKNAQAPAEQKTSIAHRLPGEGFFMQNKKSQ